MKKTWIGMTALLFTLAATALGCASFLDSGSSFKSLPETSEYMKLFDGPWMSHDAYSRVSEGSIMSQRGPQFYVFYEDGTGEILDYGTEENLKKGIYTNRRVFRYRVSDTYIGFDFMSGSKITGGGNFTRPYTVSADKRRITFPYQKAFIGEYAEFSIDTNKPPPDPPPPPPPPPEPPAEPGVNNAGRIYYDNEGTGYVYLGGDSVFYRCRDGKPLGYVEQGLIYAFTGQGLGVLQGNFIHDTRGYPLGAVDPKDLGTQAADKRVPRKAEMQNLPPKQPRAPFTRPRLRHRYFGDLLADMFPR
jgi:hypothetical protein